MKSNQRCTHCGASLKASEVITCDPCEIAQLRLLLASAVWREVRGQMVVADFKNYLAALEARQ